MLGMIRLARSQARMGLRWHAAVGIVGRRTLTHLGESVSAKVTDDSKTPLVLSTGRVASVADGSVVANHGGHTLLANAVGASGSADGYAEFSVNYREYASAVGAVPGRRDRRDGGERDHEILVSRLIDRSLRPMFPNAYNRATQITVSLLEFDRKSLPDVDAVNSASAAIHISDIPWAGPVGSVRVARVMDEWVVNPDKQEMDIADFNLVYAGNREGALMLEMDSEGVRPEDFKEAIRRAHESIQPILQAQDDLRVKKGVEKLGFDPTQADQIIVAKTKSTEALAEVSDPADGKEITREGMMKILKEKYNERYDEILSQGDLSKRARTKLFNDLGNEIIEDLQASGDYDYLKTGEINNLLGELSLQRIRYQVLHNNQRADGRGMDDIRKLKMDVDVLPTLQGSALFDRGETQVLCVATVDIADSAKRDLDLAGEFQRPQNFMVHYSFPPFSVNETGNLFRKARRDVGHGRLAEKALEAVFPEDFAHTVRLTSQVMSSDGSSSMATVCGGTLALLDAGIRIREPVAGVTCGLITELDNAEDPFSKYVLPLDIRGLEDACGDMDFKLCGTPTGLTACQMDIKLKHLPLKVLDEAIDRASNARHILLNAMKECISGPRKDRNPETIVQTVMIPIKSVDGTKRLIGRRGSTIRSLQEKFGVDIDITDDNQVRIDGKDAAAVAEAQTEVEALVTSLFELHAELRAKVKQSHMQGLMLQFENGQQALLPRNRMSRVGGAPKPGDIVDVRVISFDDFGRPVLAQMGDDEMEEAETFGKGLEFSFFGDKQASSSGEDKSDDLFSEKDLDDPEEKKSATTESKPVPKRTMIPDVKREQEAPREYVSSNKQKLSKHGGLRRNRKLLKSV
eukprot:Clim_evm22s253 gene=Clim_evmTU22s253